MAQQNRSAYNRNAYNTNAYNTYNNYNGSARPVTYNSSAAPKIKPAPQKKPNLTLIQRTRRTAAQVRQQTAVDTKRTLKVMVVSITVLLFMALAIFSRVQLDEVNREISAVENKMELANSESIRINNELNAIMSINNVEDYAINELGMVKIQEHQVVYVDLSDSDFVAKVDGKNIDTPKVINEQ